MDSRSHKKAHLKSLFRKTAPLKFSNAHVFLQSIVIVCYFTLFWVCAINHFVVKTCRCCHLTCSLSSLASDRSIFMIPMTFLLFFFSSAGLVVSLDLLQSPQVSPAPSSGQYLACGWHAGTVNAACTFHYYLSFKVSVSFEISLL